MIKYIVLLIAILSMTSCAAWFKSSKENSNVPVSTDANTQNASTPVSITVESEPTMQQQAPNNTTQPVANQNNSSAVETNNAPDASTDNNLDNNNSGSNTVQ
jgi:hypothetical protein